MYIHNYIPTMFVVKYSYACVNTCIRIFNSKHSKWRKCEGTNKIRPIYK